MDSGLLLLLGCLVLGWVLRASGAFDEGSSRSLSAWVINVALPATALVHIHKIDVPSSWLLAAASPWVGVAFAWGIFAAVGKWLGWSPRTVGTLVLVAGWGNTSFVGIPMVVTYFGPEWVSLVLVIDILGSYMALSTLGLFIAARYGGHETSPAAMTKRILSFPPFLALVFAFAVNDVPRPEWLENVLQPIAATLTPIAMAAVGAALRFRALGSQLALLAIGLAYRLVVAPTLLLGLYLFIANRTDPVNQVALFEMAMPPMLGASVIAIRYGLDEDLIAALIGLGIPLSMVTLPLWYIVLTG